MSEGSSSDEEMSGASHDVIDLAQEEDGAGGEEFGLSADQMAFVVVFDKVQDILQGFDAALSMLDEQHTPWTKCEVVCAASIARRASLPLDHLVDDSEMDLQPGSAIVLASPDRASADGVIIAADLDTLIAVVRAATNSSSLTAAVRSRLEAIAAVHGRDYGVTLHRNSVSQMGFFTPPRSSTICATSACADALEYPAYHEKRSPSFANRRDSRVRGE
jgi:hypothetical protein